MVNATALAPKASLAYMQSVMGVQPCRQAGVDYLSVPTMLRSMMPLKGDKKDPESFLSPFLKMFTISPGATVPRYKVCAPHGLHEPSKHVQDGWAPVL